MPVRAQDYNIGENAYKRGDFETALQHFRPLAKNGHAKAQEHLGFMYSNGLGVSQDDVQAYLWYTVAYITYRTGDDREMAVEYREAVAERMAPE